MAASLDDYRKRLRENPAAQGRLNDLRGMAQEVPRMEALTGSIEWDHLLRYMEAHIKATERQIAAKRDQAAALVLVDETKAKEAAVLVAAYTARAETLREIILLPKWILQNGQAAAKLVAELEASV